MVAEIASNERARSASCMAAKQGILVQIYWLHMQAFQYHDNMFF